MKKVGILFFIVLFVFCSLGCDPKGDFSEEETMELFQELKEDFSNSDIWNGSITIEHEIGNRSQTIDFVRKAMELWNQKDADQSIFAYWFDSETYCRICVLHCNESIQTGGKSYFINDISIAKFRYGKYQIMITYQSESESQDSNIVEITLP